MSDETDILRMIVGRSLGLVPVIGAASSHYLADPPELVQLAPDLAMRAGAVTPQDDAIRPQVSPLAITPPAAGPVVHVQSPPPAPPPPPVQSRAKAEPKRAPEPRPAKPVPLPVAEAVAATPPATPQRPAKTRRGPAAVAVSQPILRVSIGRIEIERVSSAAAGVPAGRAPIFRRS